MSTLRFIFCSGVVVYVIRERAVRTIEEKDKINSSHCAFDSLPGRLCTPRTGVETDFLLTSLWSTI